MTRYMFCFTPHASSVGALEETYKSYLKDGDHLDIVVVTKEAVDAEGMADGFVGFAVDDEISTVENATARKIRKILTQVNAKYPRKITSSYKIECSDKAAPVFLDLAVVLKPDTIIVPDDTKDHKTWFEHSTIHGIQKHAGSLPIKYVDAAPTVMVPNFLN